MREGNYNRADSLERLINTRVSAADTLFFDLLTAYQKNDTAEQVKLRRLIDEDQKDAPPERPIELRLWRNLITPASDIDDAERVLQRGPDAKAKPQTVRAYANSRAFTALMRGRFREARRLYAESREPGSGGVDADLALEPFLIPPAAELQQLRDRLAHQDSTPGPLPDPASVLRAHFRLYWMAMLNCRLGNIPEALSQAQRMETLPAPSYWQPAVAALATDVRAFADIAQGNIKEALDRIESIPIDVPLDLMNTEARRDQETGWHGELLFRLGRYDEALRYFENPSEFNSEVWPFYMLRRAQIHDRKGDTKQAAALYAQFLAYWKDPDPELRLLIDQARTALIALQAKGD